MVASVIDSRVCIEGDAKRTGCERAVRRITPLSSKTHGLNVHSYLSFVMKSALEEIGLLLIHLKSLSDLQETLLRQVMEHLLPLLTEEKKKKQEEEEEEDSDEFLYERLTKMDKMTNSKAWRNPDTEHHGPRKEEDADVGRNNREPRKEDEDESEARGVGKSSEDGRRLFDVAV